MQGEVDSAAACSDGLDQPQLQMGGAGGGGGGGGVHVIEERLAPADMSAARSVLRHM